MRLFFQTKIYDYETKQEAESHMKKMILNGWHIMKKENGESILFLGEDVDNAYEVEYYKEGN